MSPSLSPVDHPPLSEAQRIAALENENRILKHRLEMLRPYVEEAVRDPLTLLYNRRFFDRRLSEEEQRARRHGRRKLSIICVDVDDFKQINDEHGHGQGDEILCWVASFLSAGIRQQDVCCRVGGDEFALILPDTGEQDCRRLIRRLRRRLDEANLWIRTPVSLSIGGASLEAGETIGTLFQRADENMFRDKNNKGKRPVRERTCSFLSEGSTTEARELE